MASLVHKLRESSTFKVKVCVTAQQRQMLDQVLNFFELIPDYDLDIMQENQSLNELSGRIFLKMDEVLEDFEPEIILVHGDTTTSSVCAWAAFNRHIKVAHVEAGLRTFNKWSPFPEELNRQLTSRIADYHFAPTIQSQQNLLDENVATENILVTGNTVIDSLFWTIEKLEKGFLNSKIEELSSVLDFNKKIILVTGHRRENFGEGFMNICKSLKHLAENNDVEIVYPVHLNPQVQKPVLEMISGISNIHLISPLDYPSFVWLMTKSYLIITDSGGIQEEAPSLGKPVLVLREITERPEALSEGTVKLVGTNSKKIIQTTENLLDNQEEYGKMSRAYNPYGDGNACLRIINFFEKLKV
jgi:UDP-N-acetylglucosamine 2-epimerase (non-hydrolysing)